MLQDTIPSRETNSPVEPRTATLVPANGVDHGPACGERVACPSGCDRGPYLTAERQVRRFVTVIICHACRGAWREAAG